MTRRGKRGALYDKLVKKAFTKNPDGLIISEIITMIKNMPIRTGEKRKHIPNYHHVRKSLFRLNATIIGKKTVELPKGGTRKADVFALQLQRKVVES